ncbi:MAG: DUF6464 family protein [Cyanobacteriota bacterium]|nr:DUF6464 family protein [Cyanobacteriota bacterium]
MSKDPPLDTIALRSLRERAYQRFLQEWRRQVLLMRHHVWESPTPSLGDPSCLFNAHTSFLRCAVNPSGPCQGCPDYQRDPSSMSGEEQSFRDP